MIDAATKEKDQLQRYLYTTEEDVAAAAVKEGAKEAESQNVEVVEAYIRTKAIPTTTSSQK